ncbi:MAG: tetratricopeptide repeat protein [Candidatus Riflebacteria bacterium]|nr:tetratricopeptide repeat protein [Candidatus Riflebacteria bacterium]
MSCTVVAMLSNWVDETWRVLSRGVTAVAVAAVVVGLGAGALWADSAELHNTTGLAYYYQGKDAEAFAEFVKALDKDPSFAQPHFNLARLFERQKRYEETLRQYKHPLQRDQTLNGAREGIERMETALAARGQAPTPQPAPSGALSSNAQEDQLTAIRGLMEKGELGEARRRLDALERINPNNVDVLLLLADLTERAGQYDATVGYLQRVKTVVPGRPDISFKLARVLMTMGNHSKALAEVERAIQLNPQQSEYYNLMGDIYTRMGKPSEAYTAFNEASRLNPKNFQARKTADDISGKMGLYYYNAGLFYFHQKSWIKAKDALTRAVEKGNLNPEQMAIAQQYLVIADFSSAKVADQIKAIQAERDLVEKGHVEKRVSVAEAESKPASFPEGRYVDFRGWIVARKDSGNASELIVTKNFREVEVREQKIRDGEDSDGGFRSNSRMVEWYTVFTPRTLPNDPRIAPSSKVRVKGTLGTSQYIRNPYNFIFSQLPQPTVKADYLEFSREQRQTFGFGEYDTGDRSIIGERERRVDRSQPRPPVNTPPGLAGPLKIDFLRYNEEQLRNLDRSGEL